MPIDTRHPQYEAIQNDWKTIRDAIAGDPGVKAEGERYLPRLYDQTNEEYKAYSLRALFFGATARTIEAFQGMLTRKAPQIEAPALDEIIRDCDLQGASFKSHIQSVLWELLTVARGGTLIDWSATDNRSYITAYHAEQIINWKTERIGGKRALSFVMIEEESSEYRPETGEPAPDAYATGTYKQWRELRLIQNGTATACVVTIWRKSAKEKDAFVAIAPATTLTRRGIALPFIPFVPHGLDIDKTVPSKPIALDLALVNIAQFRNSADYENGLHMAGLPTPWAAGFTDDTKSTLVMGTSRVWVTEDTSAKCGFLEYTGAGLNSLKVAMEDKSTQMAALGARVLDAPQNSAEATETVKLRQTSESNILTDLATCAEESLSEVLRILAWWMGTNALPNDSRDKIFVAINKDLLGSKLQPTQVAALVQAMQAGVISFQTFFWNMQQGNMYPEGTDEETEKTAIEQNPPPPPAPSVPPAEKTPPASK